MAKTAKSPKSDAGAPGPTEAATPALAPPLKEAKGKLGMVIAMLRRPGGATINALSEATGWQEHSVRGALAGALKKKRGLNIESEKTEAGRIYRIVDEAAA